MRDQERVFADEYLIDLNATQAALRAGYRPRTAAKAAEWIHADHPSKPALRAYIDEALAVRSRRTGVTADRVVRELARVAFGDPLSVIDPETGGLLPEIDREDRAMIAGYRRKEGDDWCEREVKLCDRVRALELLGRHMGMFTDVVKAEVSEAPRFIDDVEAPAARAIGFDAGGDGHAGDTDQ